MSFQPDPLQALYLWSLLFEHGGECINKQMNEQSPKLSAAKRNGLRDAGLIDTSEKKGGTFIVRLTEKGWNWANEHLDAELSQRSPAGNRILKALLTNRIKPYLAHNGATIADLFMDFDHPAVAPSTVEPAIDPATISARIRAVYRELANDESNARVRIADLRKRLADIPRDVLDNTLIEMSRLQQLQLDRGEDPRELLPEDHAAPIELGGQLNHFLRME